MTPVEPDPSAGLNGAVAGELRAAKARRQSSNEQIAERSAIPLVSVNRYMAGKRPINLAILAELAAALEVDPSDVVSSALTELSRGGVVIQGDFGNSSDDGSSLDHLKGQPSAAAPKRRDTGEGDDDA
jgi:transcriptional regulator with XRE-family HTH domain